jgi:hypothetical protein
MLITTRIPLPLRVGVGRIGPINSPGEMRFMITIQPTYFFYLWLPATVLFICTCHFFAFFSLLQEKQNKKVPNYLCVLSNV